MVSSDIITGEWLLQLLDKECEIKCFLISKFFGIKLLNKLVIMGAVKMEVLEVPYMDISVSAGFPSPAADYLEERINLNSFLINNPLSTFIVKCSGLSMVNAFIPPKCHLVVDRSLKANNGDIVLAYVNGGFTVKYLQINEHKCRLIPANKKAKEIEITEHSGLIIWGVVTSIISNPKDFKDVCFG